MQSFFCLAVFIKLFFSIQFVHTGNSFWRSIVPGHQYAWLSLVLTYLQDDSSNYSFSGVGPGYAIIIFIKF